MSYVVAARVSLCIYVYVCVIPGAAERLLQRQLKLPPQIGRPTPVMSSMRFQRLYACADWLVRKCELGE